MVVIVPPAPPVVSGNQEMNGDNLPAMLPQTIDELIDVHFDQ
jgi:hypothetical protein